MNINKKSLMFVCMTLLLIIIFIIAYILLHNKRNSPLKIQAQVAFDNILSCNNDNMPPFLKELKKSCSIEVKNVTECDGAFKADVKIEYPDVSTDLSNYLKSNPTIKIESVDSFNNDIVQMIDNSKIEKKNFTIYLTQTGETLTPVLTTEALDSLYGGIYSMYYEYLEESFSRGE